MDMYLKSVWIDSFLENLAGAFSDYFCEFDDDNLDPTPSALPQLLKFITQDKDFDEVEFYPIIRLLGLLICDEYAFFEEISMLAEK